MNREPQVPTVSTPQAPDIAVALPTAAPAQTTTNVLQAAVAGAPSTASEGPPEEGTRSDTLQNNKRPRDERPLAQGNQLITVVQKKKFLSFWTPFAPKRDDAISDEQDLLNHLMDVEEQPALSYEELQVKLEELISLVLKEFKVATQNIRKMHVALSRFLHQRTNGTLPKHLSLEFKPGNPFPACVPNSKQFFEEQAASFQSLMYSMLYGQIEFLQRAIQNAEEQQEIDFSPGPLEARILHVCEPFAHDPRFDLVVKTTHDTLMERLGALGVQFQEKYASKDREYFEKQQRKQASSRTTTNGTSSGTASAGDQDVSPHASASATAAEAPAARTTDRASTINDTTCAKDLDDILNAKLEARFNSILPKFQNMIKKSVKEALEQESGPHRQTKKDSKNSSSPQQKDRADEHRADQHASSRPSSNNAASKANSSGAATNSRTTNNASTTQPSNKQSQRSANERSSDNKPSMSYKEAVKKIPQDLAQKIAEHADKDGEWTFVAYKRPPKDPASSDRNTKSSLWRNKNNNNNPHSRNQGNGWRHRNKKKD